MSIRSKVTLLWVCLHNEIQRNEDPAVARKRLFGSSILSPKLAICASSCVGRLEIKESLTKKHPGC
jgi:hypothetical protein